jgi:thiamine-phosphate pyrophosphorylase
MARCYSARTMKRQPTLPRLWLISDARNDARLEAALHSLPRGSGFIFRHYHLPPKARRARFAALARLARARGLVVLLAGSTAEARRWGADGAYGPPDRLSPSPAGLRLATAHSLRELATARAIGADAALLSPAYPTRSHPGAAALGPVRWRALAARARVPVIALGGMNARRARALGCRHWAAIDGLS